MSKKPTITTVSSGFAANTQINGNFTALRDAFDNTLSLDGSTPNAMNADIDLNGNDVLNVNLLEAQAITVAGAALDLGAAVAAANASAVAADASADASAASAVQAALYDGPWLDDVATLLADTSLTYTAGSPSSVVAGDYVRTRAEGFAYEVAASGASDQHITTAGGVKLYVLPGQDGRVPLRAFGASGDGIADDHPEAQNAASSASSVSVGDGTFLISSEVNMTVPKSFVGNGATSKFVTTVGFTGAMLRIGAAAGTDPKGWTVSDFELTNNGSATHGILLDIAGAGEYLSKLTISKIVSNTQVSSHFVELVNTIPNIDGLFTMVFADNWSFGGYYLDNVGDSVLLERNTTTGAGVGYYVKQLATAANVIIRDGNCTSAGGALLMQSGANLIFEGMQVECPVAFTGSNNAAVSIAGTSTIYNVKIRNNNINTQGNPLYCIYVQNAIGTIIDGNDLYCDPGAGAHIYLDTTAQDTVIGNNRYYDRNTGAEIAPIIVNAGVGNRGVWVDATLTLAGWSNQNTANEHPTGYFLDRDGNVMLRGRVAGAAIAGGETLFTLPVGYRPKTKGYLIGTYGAAGADTSVVLQIIPAGNVQILTAGATGVYLSGVVFSTK